MRRLFADEAIAKLATIIEDEDQGASGLLLLVGKSEKCVPTFHF